MGWLLDKDDSWRRFNPAMKRLFSRTVFSDSLFFFLSVAIRDLNIDGMQCFRHPDPEKPCKMIINDSTAIGLSLVGGSTHITDSVLATTTPILTDKNGLSYFYDPATETNIPWVGTQGSDKCQDRIVLCHPPASSKAQKKESTLSRKKLLVFTSSVAKTLKNGAYPASSCCSWCGVSFKMNSTKKIELFDTHVQSCREEVFEAINFFHSYLEPIMELFVLMAKMVDDLLHSQLTSKRGGSLHAQAHFLQEVCSLTSVHVFFQCDLLEQSYLFLEECLYNFRLIPEGSEFPGHPITPRLIEYYDSVPYENPVLSSLLECYVRRDKGRIANCTLPFVVVNALHHMVQQGRGYVLEWAKFPLPPPNSDNYPPNNPLKTGVFFPSDKHRSKQVRPVPLRQADAKHKNEDGSLVRKQKDGSGDGKIIKESTLTKAAYDFSEPVKQYVLPNSSIPAYNSDRPGNMSLGVSIWTCVPEEGYRGDHFVSGIVITKCAESVAKEGVTQAAYLPFVPEQRIYDNCCQLWDWCCNHGLGSNSTYNPVF
jgi:hypothetical protein